MGTFQSGQRCVSISAGDRRVCADQEDGTDEIKGSRGRGFEGSRDKRIKGSRGQGFEGSRGVKEDIIGSSNQVSAFNYRQFFISIL